jgi:hypothetical protein
MTLTMNLQESIIYSYDLATVPSILPAFANSRDLIIVDEVHFVCPIPRAPCKVYLTAIKAEPVHDILASCPNQFPSGLC